MNDKNLYWENGSAFDHEDEFKVYRDHKRANGTQDSIIQMYWSQMSLDEREEIVARILNGKTKQ